MPKPIHPVAGRLAVTGITLLGKLPVRMASDLLAYIAGKYFRLFVKHSVIRKNLAVAFPDFDQPALDATTKSIAANFGRYLVEVANIPAFSTGKRGTKVSATGSLDYAIKQSGQVIFVTAHLGNWELTPIVLRRSSSLLIIYSLIGIPIVDNWLLSRRERTGAKYVEKSKALRACVKAMKGGDSIGLLVDQRVERGVDVSFLGRPTIVTDLPARMALKFNCPIVPVEAVRENPRHTQVVFHEPIWPGEKQGEQAIRELTQQMATVIEGGIRRRPGDWYCHKRRWKSAGGADTDYSCLTADQDAALEARMA